MGEHITHQSSPVIAVESITVRYGRRSALNSVSMEVTGRIVGLLGPNGAGKTTLLSVLATVCTPHSGSVAVLGRDASTASGRSEIRPRIGWLPQRFNLSGSMTLRDTVAYAAWCHGVGAADSADAGIRALEVVGLADRCRDRVRRLSGGQRQRLGLACAIAHDPEVLLLDEPTVGLDPSQRVRFRRYLKAVSSNRTIILATHLIEDCAHLCDELVVLNGGVVAYHGSADALAGASAEPHLQQRLATPFEAAYERLISGDAMRRPDDDA